MYAGQWVDTAEPFAERFYKNWIMPFTPISIALNDSGQMMFLISDLKYIETVQ